MKTQPLSTFQDAVLRLAQHGIGEQHIYLVDLAILAEMAWADDCIQQAEVELLIDYMEGHIEEINRLAGCIVLDQYTAADFVAELIEQRPDPELLQALREAFIPIRLINKSEDEADEIASALLSACLDIAASSVTNYPYGLKERFTQEEKAYYHTLQRLLSQGTR